MESGGGAVRRTRWGALNLRNVPRTLVGAVLLLVASNGCGPEAAPVPPPPPIAGDWEGEMVAGQVTWTLQQNGVDVAGQGAFVPAAAESSATYTLRGKVSHDSLNVRLLGAPGDSNVDSVYYSGRFDYELYAGLTVTGVISAPSGPLNGALTLFLVTPP